MSFCFCTFFFLLIKHNAKKIQLVFSKHSSVVELSYNRLELQCSHWLLQIRIIQLSRDDLRCCNDYPFIVVLFHIVLYEKITAAHFLNPKNNLVFLILHIEIPIYASE